MSQTMMRLVLSCGYERQVTPLMFDAHGINEGDTGWCPEHEDATVQAMFVDDDFRVTQHRGSES